MISSGLTNSPPPPYLRFRDATLTYHGPEPDRRELCGLKEVKIGWFGPSEATNPLWGDAWRAANLAIDEANQKGGCNGLPFRLVPRWAVDPWGTGISQLTRMIFEERPMAVLGSIDSASTHLAEQIVAKAQLPLISPFATDHSITLAGVSWMFSCAPSDRTIAQVLVEDILKTVSDRPHRLVLLSATDHESRMTAREVLKEFSRRGRLPDFRYEMPPGSNTYAKQMDAIDQVRPDAVLIVAGAEDSARLVMAIREHAPPARLFGIHTMGQNRFRQMAGPAAEGVRFPALFVPDSSHSDTVRFLASFQPLESAPPDYTAALAYDAMRLLLDALQRSGLKRNQLRESIGQLTPRIGIAGSMQFDGTGQNTRSNLGMAEITKGALVISKTAQRQTRNNE